MSDDKKFKSIVRIPNIALQERVHKDAWRSLARTLFGSDWATVFSEYAGIKIETVYYWTSNKGKVPKWAVLLLKFVERYNEE